MKCSFSIANNDISGGEVMGLVAEGFSDPTQILGKTITIKLYEIDTLVGKRKESTLDDFIAEFEVELVKGSAKDYYYFDPAKTKRVDPFDNMLPKPEYRNDSAGNLLPVPLQFEPLFFRFYLDSGTINVDRNDQHIILIRSDSNELEMYIYEIGFTVELGGEIIFDARKMPAYVNCCNILAKNCKNTAEFFRQNHIESKKLRGVGTHYGDHHMYAYKNERAYLEMVSQFENRFIDENWIQQNIGIDWEPIGKSTFDRLKTSYNLQPTSCIGYVLDVMAIGFEKSNMKTEWNRIVAYVKNGMGQWLAKGLTDNGWVALYYNPDVNHPNDDDNEHIQSFLIAKKKRQYGSSAWPPVIPVFDFIVNYKPTPLVSGANFQQEPYNVITVLEKEQVDLLKNVPFGFLMSRGGKHTAIICNGNVHQVHWTEGPISDKLFDAGDFIAEWDWNSGLIVVPQAFWPKANYKFI